MIFLPLATSILMLSADPCTNTNSELYHHLEVFGFLDQPQRSLLQLVSEL